MEEKKSLIYWTRVKPLFKGVYDGAETKLNVAGNAVEPIKRFLEDRIMEGLNDIVKAMPRKKKGAHEGELIRKTIKPLDIRTAKAAHTRMLKTVKKAKAAKKRKKKRR